MFENGRGALDGKTLASLARTCRSFHDPALDLLYADMTTLKPLIKCMPRDLWKETEQELTFMRPMTHNDWNIFQRYARRVRRLYFGPDIRPLIGSAVYQALGYPPFPSGSVLFPKLHKLQTNQIVDDEIPFLNVLLKSPLKELLLDVRAGGNIEKTLSLFLPSLRRKCPSIKHLGLSGNRDPESHVMKTLLAAVHQFTNLVFLQCDVVTNDTIIYAARLPSLGAFHFSLPTQVSINSVAPRLGGSGFPTLRDVAIRSRTLASCLQFLELSTTSSFESLSFTVEDRTRAHDLYSIFASWSSSSSYQKLSSLDITELNYQYLTYDDTYVIDLPVLRPLFRFSHLERLSLEIFCTFSLGNEAVKEMASAWPHIQTLDISYREQGWEIPTRITLPGIIPLLQNCPYLQYLGLVVDATVVSASAARLPGAGVRNTSLGTLYLADSPITRPALVAAFLSSVSPYVSLLAWNSESLLHRPGGRKYRKRWKQVYQMLGSFVMARKQERTGLDLMSNDDGADDLPVQWESDTDTDFIRTGWLEDISESSADSGSESDNQ
ncbi:hypothetical protein BV22DRAFT_1034258 [Leucogyrophana mollusca]|uniref:Uncharacterized protein n=1 Tax=Leucogyrophana mollusca TaxID=85980 RepID=A0ACB8BI52_9AGAM|nr:hypothetical protein BV22DRAFT_1034258 [Leucogyrophana mollusca]